MTTLDEKGLAPCPFCGSPAELEHGSDHHGEWFNLGCSQHWGKVEACPAGRLWYTELPEKETEAIAAWNRRAPAQSINAEMLAEMKAAAGYLRNAMIDLQTGATKATAIRTIDGGLTRLEAAIARAEAATDAGGDA